jgi:hypothetical protein
VAAIVTRRYRGSPAFGADLFGRTLDRDAALSDDRLDAFWAVVDHVLVNDETVAKHVHGPD